MMKIRFSLVDLHADNDCCFVRTKTKARPPTTKKYRTGRGRRVQTAVWDGTERLKYRRSRRLSEIKQTNGGIRVPSGTPWPVIGVREQLRIGHNVETNASQMCTCAKISSARRLSQRPIIVVFKTTE